MKKIIYASVTLLFFSCNPNIDLPVPAKGNLDLTTFVAVGNSITAGYADNALYCEAQQSSFPNLLARQFKSLGGGDFKQPMVDAASVGIGATLNARLVLAPVTDCSGATSLLPVNAAAMGDITILGASVASQGPFNNLGVPGAKAITVIYPGYGNPNNGQGNFNPFFTRIATDPASASILSDAAAQSPTFFSLSIGNDDVYSYALSGGTADVITPTDGVPGVGFDASIDLIANTLTAGGASGVVANIPDISSLPFFTTIPYNGLMLDHESAVALTASYSPLGISFQAGPNGFIIEDANAPGGMRQMAEGEMVLLSVPQDSLKCAGWGSVKPIPNQYVLTAGEISNINSAVTAYNAKLKSVADEKNLAFADVNSFMSHVKSGILYNGVSINAQFVAGGAFSLDGIHLTPIGNALMANEFIRAINSKYGSTIPQIDATQYRGVALP